jgi:hypothetical protein
MKAIRRWSSLMNRGGEEEERRKKKKIGRGKESCQVGVAARELLIKKRLCDEQYVTLTPTRGCLGRPGISAATK